MLVPQSLPSTLAESTHSDSESSVDLSEDEAEEDTALLALQVSNDCPDFYQAMQALIVNFGLKLFKKSTSH